MQRNEQVEQAGVFGMQKVDNDEVYRRLFSGYMESHLSETRPDEPQPQFPISASYPISGLFTFQRQFFNLDSLNQRNYRRFAHNVSQSSKHFQKWESPISIVKSSSLQLKAQEFGLRKRHYFPDNYDPEVHIHNIMNPYHV
jgi:hypothetical protein